MKRILVTGAAGFAGAHIVEEILKYEDTKVVALDSLTYAGRLDRLAHLDKTRIKFVYHDFSQPLTEATLKSIGGIDFVIHNGAESHVLRSFENPRLFATSNIIGTLNILEAARKLNPKTFIYVSTDEVFGSASDQPFKEDDVLQPTNPYAASKASGEFLAYSYFRSFGLPVVISRTMNMYGERQHPEKFLPKITRQILRGQMVKIHGICKDGSWFSGSRKWLHARAQANALIFLLKNGIPGEKYNVAGLEKSNYEIAQWVASILGLQVHWEWSLPQGPVHDFAYDLDDSKLRNLGWKSPVPFETSFRQTVEWTAANPQWLES